MDKQFVPYEQALELKELGFDEECIAVYFVPTKGLHYGATKELITNYTEDVRIAAPLYQQAFKFFRDEFGYTFSIGRTNICVYHLMVQGTLLTNMIQDCTSYEQAELKCLTEFIDAAKQKQ